jgi:hypothetical protein
MRCTEMAAVRLDTCEGITDITDSQACGTTNYEIKYPPDALGLDMFYSGLKFGFSICVNDGDTDGANQAGQRGWSGWAPYSILYGKEAENAGLAELVGEWACTSVDGGAPPGPMEFYFGTELPPADDMVDAGNAILDGAQVCSSPPPPPPLRAARRRGYLIEHATTKSDTITKIVWWLYARLIVDARKTESDTQCQSSDTHSNSHSRWGSAAEATGARRPMPTGSSRDSPTAGPATASPPSPAPTSPAKSRAPGPRSTTPPAPAPRRARSTA